MEFVLHYWTKHLMMVFVAVVLVKPLHMVRGQLVERLGKDYKTLIIICIFSCYYDINIGIRVYSDKTII